MRKRTVLDGNAFYEIDEECMEQKCRRRETEKKQDVYRHLSSQRTEKARKSDQCQIK